MDNFAMNGVVFCGGRGSRSIIKSLITLTHANLTIVVNAYDDGKSTGRIRDFIGNFLGPSDIRKNLSTICEALELGEISNLLEFRISRNRVDQENIAALVEKDLSDVFEVISASMWQDLQRLLTKFEEFESSQGKIFDLNDCALGNILLAGAYIECNRDFNKAVDILQNIILDSHKRIRVVNVTNGENLYLVAQAKDGTLFLDEAEIVENDKLKRIQDVYLVKNKLQKEYEFTVDASLNFPIPNQCVISELMKADFIIYGPGTQASSLLPSYLTEGIGQAIAGNTHAKKLFISNLSPDNDDPFGNVTSRISAFLNSFQKVPECEKLELEELVTHVFSELEISKLLSFDVGSTIVLLHDEWSSSFGQHLGPAIVRQLDLILMGALEPKPGFLSIVIPVLNEEKTITSSIIQLHSELTKSELPFEIVIVDGGSDDLSVEMVERIDFDELRLFQKTGFRRGQACIFGIEASRGDLIGFFHADLEYLPSDLSQCISILVDGHADLVIGSRNLKSLNTKEHIDQVYGSQKILGFLAYWGGLMIAMICLVRNRRFISDPLSGLKVFNVELLKIDDFKSKSIDFEIELIQNFTRSQARIIETPITYIPRNRKSGKKTNIREGLCALRQAVKR